MPLKIIPMTILGGITLGLRDDTNMADSGDV